jgi:uncharacterized protein YbjT (DUF2867 family)
MKVIVTGVTGFVGEGVMYYCLKQPEIEEVLAVTRRRYDHEDPKLKQLVVKDFADLSEVESQLSGYDACMYCAGVSSVGMSEADYTKVTYDTPMAFAKTLSRLNPNVVFTHISGASTDSTEKGRVMWARVKGKAENDLMKLPFKGVYNFRPGFMKPLPEMRNIPTLLKVVAALYPVIHFLLPKSGCELAEVAQAMLNAARSSNGPKQVLEVPDIVALAHA